MTYGRTHAFTELKYELKIGQIESFGMPDFQIFENEFARISALPPKAKCESFAIDEFKRFHSIAGTILTNFSSPPKNNDERVITHVLLRSLLEVFFWMLYIFDNKNSRDARYDEFVNGYKIEYSKLYAEPYLPNKAQMLPPDPSWPALKKPMPVSAVLAAVRNVHGNRLDYLYFAYRITSFDTHRKSQQALYHTAFGQNGNFPYLKLDTTIDLIANEYLSIEKRF